MKQPEVLSHRSGEAAMWSRWVLALAVTTIAICALQVSTAAASSHCTTAAECAVELVTGGVGGIEDFVEAAASQDDTVCLLQGRVESPDYPEYGEAHGPLDCVAYEGAPGVPTKWSGSFSFEPTYPASSLGGNYLSLSSYTYNNTVYRHDTNTYYYLQDHQVTPLAGGAAMHQGTWGSAGTRFTMVTQLAPARPIDPTAGTDEYFVHGALILEDSSAP